VTVARPDFADGPLTLRELAAGVGALLPERAIVCDEAITATPSFLRATATCPPHEWLSLTGGAIGQGLPLSIGAALACPDRQVVCLEGDGSALYTIQALWTQARESLDVTTVVVSNHKYSILEFELARVGAASGNIAEQLLEISGPALDFVALAHGMGVEARRVESAKTFRDAFEDALSKHGPHLIEAVV
jgi:acetolactate synthase-1/2/3 large subunit